MRPASRPTRRTPPAVEIASSSGRGPASGSGERLQRGGRRGGIGERCRGELAEERDLHRREAEGLAQVVGERGAAARLREAGGKVGDIAAGEEVEGQRRAVAQEVGEGIDAAALDAARGDDELRRDGSAAGGETHGLDRRAEVAGHRRRPGDGRSRRSRAGRARAAPRPPRASAPRRRPIRAAPRRRRRGRGR